jgi:Leucine Rich repeat
MADLDAKLRIAGGFQPAGAPTYFALINERLGYFGVAALAAALARNENTKITELVLKQTDLSDQGAAAIATALAWLGSLSELDLTENSISSEGIAGVAGGGIGLAEALAFKCSVQALVLDRNLIDDGGAAALADTLKKNWTLTKLCLAGTGMTRMGAFDLAEALRANKTIQILDLSDNVIDSRGAIALANALDQYSSLSFLDLRHNSICDSAQGALQSALQNNTLFVLQIDANVNMSQMCREAIERTANERIDAADLPVHVASRILIQSAVSSVSCVALANDVLRHENQQLAPEVLARRADFLSTMFAGSAALAKALLDPKQGPQQFPPLYIQRRSKYFSKESIGKGGFGVVFRATDEILKAQFVVKKQGLCLTTAKFHRSTTCTQREVEVSLDFVSSG